VTLRDRSKDLIISGGSNVYPREVKEVLIKHPFVREVSVIGRPDPDWGETVIAYVVGAASSEPKNSYGKILKSELRARDRTSTVASVPSRGADS